MGGLYCHHRLRKSLLTRRVSNFAMVSATQFGHQPTSLLVHSNCEPARIDMAPLTTRDGWEGATDMRAVLVLEAAMHPGGARRDVLGRTRPCNAPKTSHIAG